MDNKKDDEWFPVLAEHEGNLYMLASDIERIGFSYPTLFDFRTPMVEICAAWDALPEELLKIIRRQPVRRVVEVEADSLEEAKRKVDSEITGDVDKIAEVIVSNGGEWTTWRYADTVEAGFEKALSAVPADADIVSKDIVTSPKLYTIVATEYSEALARELAEEKITTKESIRSAKLSKRGRKGFLGIGKRPNEYEFTVSQQAQIEVTYREKVKLRAVFGKREEGPSDINDMIKRGISDEDLTKQITIIIGRILRMAFEYAREQLGEKFNIDEASKQLRMVMLLMVGRNVSGFFDMTFGGGLEMVLRSILFSLVGVVIKQAWIVSDAEAIRLTSGEEHRLVRGLMACFGLELMTVSDMLLYAKRERKLKSALDSIPPSVVSVISETALNKLIRMETLSSEDPIRTFARHYDVIRINDIAGFHYESREIVKKLREFNPLGSILHYSSYARAESPLLTGLGPVTEV